MEKEDKKPMDSVLEDLGVISKATDLNSLLEMSGIVEPIEQEQIVEEQEEVISEYTEDQIITDTDKVEFPEFEEPDGEIDPLLVPGLETADEAYRKEDLINREKTMEKFSFESDWIERYEFVNQNLGEVRHGLGADINKLVVKVNLRILDMMGSVLDEGLLVDQVFLKEDKQYGLGIKPVDLNKIKILTGKDGIIWSPSGDNLEYRLIEEFDNTKCRVEYKITVNKMLSEIPGGLLEQDERRGSSATTASVGYAGPTGPEGPPGASGVTEITEKNVIYVATNGNDTNGEGFVTNPYRTVGKAISSITSPSQANSYVIDVGPGEYTEDNSVLPISVPSDTTIKGKSNSTTHIKAFTGGNPLFNMDDHSSMIGCTLYDVTSNSAVVVDKAAEVVLQDIILVDCQDGVEVDNDSASVDIYNLTALTSTGSFTNLIKASAGRTRARNIVILGASTVGTIFRIDGSTAILHTWNTISHSSNVTNGVYVTNSGLSHSVNCEVNNSDYAFRADSSGEIYGSGCYASGSTFLDAYQEDSAAKITIDSGNFVENKVSATDWSNVNISFISSVEGDEAQNINQELHVGDPRQGRESAMGEGDSTARGMLVYTYNGSTYTNVTAAASTPSGSTFTFGNTAGNAMYLSWDLQDGSDYLQFYGIKELITVAAVIGTGTFVWEYWDGGAWETFTIMHSQGDSPYLPLEGPCFTETGSFQTRFDAYLAESGKWAKNDPPTTGTNRFWARYRIVTDLTTSPTFQQIKLHTNRFEINADGWTEYFGKGRPVSVIPWSTGLLEGAADSPSNQDLFLSDEIDVGKTENAFTNTPIGGADRIALVSNLPLDFDTSTPLWFQWSWTTDTGDGLGVDWVLRWAYSSDGDLVYYTQLAAPATFATQQTLSFTTNAPGTAFEITTQHQLLDFSGAVARRDSPAFHGDLLWISLERTAGDAHAGTVALLHLSPQYFTWCDGGHIIV